MAFWSGQDRQDQAASRLFSVLGKITSDRPEVLITAGSNRQEVKLKLDEAFDFENSKLKEDSDYSIPENAFEKITEYRYTTPAPVVGGAPYYGYDYDDYYSNTRPTNKQAKSAAKKGNSATTTPSYQTASYKAKTKLLAAVNTYFSVYNLSQVHIQSLFNSFIEFFEEETLTKNTSSSTPEEFTALFASLDTDMSASLAVLLETLFDELDDPVSTTLSVVPDENEKNSGVDTIDSVNLTEVSTLSLPEPNKKLV